MFISLILFYFVIEIIYLFKCLSTGICKLCRFHGYVHTSRSADIGIEPQFEPTESDTANDVYALHEFLPQPNDTEITQAKSREGYGYFNFPLRSTKCDITINVLDLSKGNLARHHTVKQQKIITEQCPLRRTASVPHNYPT